jgi:hypothetical protein
LLSGGFWQGFLFGKYAFDVIPEGTSSYICPKKAKKNENKSLLSTAKKKNRNFRIEAIIFSIQ